MYIYIIMHTFHFFTFIVHIISFLY
ncbi:putative membrane protein, partial [Plasmodium reichenowi]